MISHKHYASKDIKEQLERLEMTWQALLAATQEKKQRLNEAYEVIFMHKVFMSRAKNTYIFLNVENYPVVKITVYAESQCFACQMTHGPLSFISINLLNNQRLTENVS